ncbi:MAG: zf-HC2 domain-containing protein, partial [Chloroflexota bacterium]|nr:zf-HC2 domain-containing protein [Chloroflexota bacterium]
MFHFLRKRAKSEHQRVRGMLSAYIDGELSPEERALVEAHLAECESCARNLRTLRRTVELLGELPAVHAPRSFAISPAQPVKPRVKPWAKGWAYTHLRSATALAAVLLVIVLAGDVFLVGRAPAVAPAPAVMR